jgi:hypothetical protein
LTVSLGLIISPAWSAETLTLITPNGGQKWRSGDAYTIKWDTANLGGSVKIQLLKAGKPYKTIRAKTRNDGKYRWKVPSSVKSGNKYQIKIVLTKNKTISDSSDKNVAITKKLSKKKKSKSGKVLLAAGDISECKNDNSARTAKIIQRYPTATVATMGDNAYKDGSKRDFKCYDRTWGAFKSRTKPTPGNHEYRTPNASGYFRYFGKRAGQRGKGYYSYQLGAWTVVALNSVCREVVGGCAKGSPQYQWLKETLSKNKTKCTLVYMHHPWVSSGVHGRTVPIKPMVELLYNNGVDVILSGHDHMYERFARLGPDERLDNRRGIRQFVVGTGGRALKTQEKLRNIDKRHKHTQERNRKTHGVLKLNLNENSYRWEFIAVKEHKFSDKGMSFCH